MTGWTLALVSLAVIGPVLLVFVVLALDLIGFDIYTGVY